MHVVPLGLQSQSRYPLEKRTIMFVKRQRETATDNAVDP